MEEFQDIVYFEIGNDEQNPGWYFWDETWSYAHGPYATEWHATMNQHLYWYSLENGNV